MNIIITGASRGIGFELAKRFAGLGNHNIIAISRNADKLKELKSSLVNLIIFQIELPFSEFFAKHIPFRH
ncbi:MAG: hypothetical protein CVT98_07730 [Bacteroidetes bacterium HGW-Bacteroidetes-15]|nr:MAG: hypothetical protein CVT98_07730 [Bacteroidetes bacterium HGW-Bacteroidetes-15]